MSDELRPCPFCGGVHVEIVNQGSRPDDPHVVQCDDCDASASGMSADEAMAAWNRRAERTWHDFSDELPPAGVSVLCMGKNGALYVGKPVTFNGNVTRKVWVPRGDQYRTPEKWMEVVS